MIAKRPIAGLVWCPEATGPRALGSGRGGWVGGATHRVLFTADPGISLRYRCAVHCSFSAGRLVLAPFRPRWSLLKLPVALFDAGRICCYG